jgi:hypothetical protein
MSVRKRQRPRTEITFSGACDCLESLFAEGGHTAVLEQLSDTPDFREALRQLRAGMRSHRFAAPQVPGSLERIVQSLDGRTRREGFHLLESWDYRAHRFSGDSIPVLMLDRCASRASDPASPSAALGVLIDQYFLCVLGLLAARAWDDGDANANLDRITALVHAQSNARPGSSRVVDDAETLLLVAVSHYHPDEAAYDRLIEKVWGLDDAHQLNVALACAATMGSHLRWGFQYMYRRDVSRMRADNIADYPWLLFSIVTLMRAYCRIRDGRMPHTDRDRIVEALVNGLSVDPWAFTAAPPEGFRHYTELHRELRDCLGDLRAELMEEFEKHRPTPKTYTPIAFHCNFLCNAVVAIVDTAIATGAPHPSLNALFMGKPHDPAAADRLAAYSESLMAYAVENRTGTGAGEAPLIVYDPFEGVHRFNETLRELQSATMRMPAARSMATLTS